jgi:hypothetical protein
MVAQLVQIKVDEKVAQLVQIKVDPKVEKSVGTTVAK